VPTARACGCRSNIPSSVLRCWGRSRARQGSAIARIRVCEIRSSGRCRASDVYGWLTRWSRVPAEASTSNHTAEIRALLPVPCTVRSR
jgi:hypothetical protein